jgi:hypothetical protein
MRVKQLLWRRKCGSPKCPVDEMGMGQNMVSQNVSTFFWYFKSSTIFETMIPNDAND